MPIQKWEYLRLEYRYVSISDRDTGKQVAKTEKECTAYFDKLGDEGWELAATTSPESSTPVLFFKRPKE
jgi:hypothetical protein